MINPVIPTRRGAALLIVLATLVLVVVSAATLARVASTARTSRLLTDCEVTADDLLRAAQAPILHWLTSESATVVLPADSLWPCIRVLHDSWVVHGTDYELCVSAWDQCGMVPAQVARSGSPLRAGLPEQVRKILDEVVIPRGQVPGLDLYLNEAQGLQVFPNAASDDAVDLPLAIGAYVATHPSGRININTAPIELVEAALRAAGRGDREHIEAARAEGRPVTLAALSSPRRRNAKVPGIAATSTAWAFRIDIRVGPLRRSWWSVYVKQGSNQWECAQRIAIPE